MQSHHRKARGAQRGRSSHTLFARATFADSDSALSAGARARGPRKPAESSDEDTDSEGLPEARGSARVLGAQREWKLFNQAAVAQAGILKRPLLPPHQLALSRFTVTRLTTPQRLHLLFHDHRSCKLAFAFAMLVMVLICLSCAAFVVETLPEVRAFRPGCEECAPVSGLLYGDDKAQAKRAALESQCRGCEPTVGPLFVRAELVFVMAFTVEYLLRAVTAHARPPTPLSLKVREEGAVRRTLRFMVEPLNVVDVLAVVPFYASLLTGSALRLQVLRVFRLLRMGRTLRFGRVTDHLGVFLRVLNVSLPAFGVFFLFSSFLIVVSACLAFWVEGGRWDPATGEYLREGFLFNQPAEPSPYTSIAASMWWSAVTFTAVGYGDMVPHTTWGRCLGAAFMYIGVIMLAMPITVMGLHITEMHQEQLEQEEHNQRVRKFAARMLWHTYHKHTKIGMQRAWNKWRGVAAAKMIPEKRLQHQVRKEVGHWVGRTKLDQTQTHQFRVDARRALLEVQQFRKDLKRAALLRARVAGGGAGGLAAP